MSAADRLLSDVGQLAGAERAGGRPRPHRDAGFGIGISRGKPLAIAAVVLAGQDDLARIRAPRGAAIGAGRAEFDAAEAAEDIAPPRPVIDPVPHRLAEFAIARNIDTEIFLGAHDLGDGGPQHLLEAGLVGRLAGFARSVRRDQIVRARQAADMGGQNSIGAGSHSPPSARAVAAIRWCRTPRSLGSQASLTSRFRAAFRLCHMSDVKPAREG